MTIQKYRSVTQKNRMVSNSRKNKKNASFASTNDLKGCNSARTLDGDAV
jgi:hypothetical protein